MYYTKIWITLLLYEKVYNVITNHINIFFVTKVYNKNLVLLKYYNKKKTFTYFAHVQTQEHAPIHAI